MSGKLMTTERDQKSLNFGTIRQRRRGRYSLRVVYIIVTPPRVDEDMLSSFKISISSYYSYKMSYSVLECRECCLKIFNLNDIEVLNALPTGQFPWVKNMKEIFFKFLILCAFKKYITCMAYRMSIKKNIASGRVKRQGNHSNLFN